MKTLTHELYAQDGVPVAGKLSIAYSWDVLMQDGGVYSSTPKTHYSADGVFSVPILAADDPGIEPGYEGFTTRVSWSAIAPDCNGRMAEGKVTSKTIQVVLADPEPVSIADLDNVTPATMGGVWYGQDVSPAVIAAAVEAYLAANPIGAEGIQDVVGAMIVAAGGTYDDEAGTITLPSSGGSGGTLTATDTPSVPAEGTSASYLVTAAVTWPVGLVWSTDPDGGEAPTITDAALVSLFTLGGTTYAVMGATFPDGSSAPTDATAPTVGTLVSSAVGVSGFTISVTGAYDEGGLHPQPFRFSIDNGVTWSDWQTSEHYLAEGLDPATEYTCVHQVRDAALNTATGSTITVTTSTPDPGNEPPEWTATFTMGTPLPTSVTATASALATDDVAVTGYQVSYDDGGSWAAITPSGSVFTLAGSAATTYSTTKLRAVDGSGAFSTPISVPSYTLASESVPVTGTWRGMHAWGATTAVPIGAAPVGDETRSVIVAIMHFGAGSSVTAMTDCTINGVTATRDWHFDNTGTTHPVASIFRAEVPSGTTAAIVASGGTAATSQARMAVWTVDHAVELIDADGTARVSEASVTLDTVAGGLLVAGVVGGLADAAPWSVNVTVRDDGPTWAAADIATTASSTTVTHAGYQERMIAASYRSA